MRRYAGHAVAAFTLFILLYAGISTLLGGCVVAPAVPVERTYEPASDPEPAPAPTTDVFVIVKLPKRGGHSPRRRPTADELSWMRQCTYLIRNLSIPVNVTTKSDNQSVFLILDQRDDEQLFHGSGPEAYAWLLGYSTERMD